MISLITPAADFSLLDDDAPRAVSCIAQYDDGSPAYIFTQTGVISLEQLRDGFLGAAQISIMCASTAEANTVYDCILADVQRLNTSVVI